MKFNQDSFILNSGDFLYAKLMDFIECEINQHTFQSIVYILSSDNIRSIEYEGNQYAIIKKENSSDILIVDEVAEENGVSSSQSRFKIDKFELINLIENKMHI